MDNVFLPEMPKPREKARVFELQYHNQQRRTVYATAQSRVVREGTLIVSHTNAHGVISRVNRSFIEISGFRESELLKMPHCIVRHPDMPMQIFKNMWDKLNAGHEWHGYLKNLCKNGDYYWINAHIKPTVANDHIMGYTSVGRAVSDRLILQFEALYAEMIRQEAMMLNVYEEEETQKKQRGLFGWKK